MRMRKLGRSQSIIFIVPPEIRRKITELHQLPEDGDISVVDVLCWSVSETWAELRRLAPIWATQGLRHQRQKRFWCFKTDTGQQFQSANKNGAAVDERFLERATRTLQERYHPADALKQPALAAAAHRKSSEGAKIWARCKAFGIRRLDSSPLGEEQERELSAEVEEERIVERPPNGQPHKPSLCPDVKTFITTGEIPPGSPAFMPAFDALAGSSIGHLLGRLKLPSGLLATADFARTVHRPSPQANMDAYQQSVQWIATAPSRRNELQVVVVVVVSSWEANAILPMVRSNNTTATLHLFAPRTSLATRSAESLTLYTTPALPPGWAPPRLPILLLLLFAGQLYLGSYASYVEMCQLLGAPYRIHDLTEDGKSQGEGAGRPGSGGEEGTAAFRNVLAPFFSMLVGQIRHDCAHISNTDLGCILMGDVLPPSEFSRPSRARS